MSEPLSIGEAPTAGESRELPKAAKVFSAVSNAALYIAGAGLVIMSVIVLWQVILRFFLNWNNSWTELTAILIMSWFIFLGAAVGVRENYHLGFDVLLYVLPKGSKKILRTISDVMVICFAIGMIYYGWQLMVLQWDERMPALGISGAYRYLPLAVGGVLILLFSAERIALRWSGVDVDQDVHDQDEVPSVADVKEV
ncbi:TRAP transporter small permease [Chelativorans sp. J32]|jgi:TRAP-type C4-dicarboxylate transport system, small permease component|uniref:TRAP transporter small permease n=1 Tax=Chelativorans sp. J32 TaxID=935840 RepID=UPI0004BA886A|nr:TRAP transporter small permease [Chelativorans sp. J32]